VKAQLQRLEIEPAGAHDHDLAIEHAALRQLHPQRLDQLRVVTPIACFAITPSSAIAW
jgi:hypothetical protein